MSTQKPIGILGVLVLVLLAAALAAGCGVGKASNQEKISKTATSYLRALADGETANIDVNGNRATARWSEPQPAHFVLAKVGTEWRIDSGYTLS